VNCDAVIFKLGSTLIHFLWQGTVVALALAAGLHLLRNSSARRRYTVACIALLWLVVEPLATFCLIPAPVPEPVESFAAPATGTGWLETVKALPTLPAAALDHSLSGQYDRLLPFVVAFWGLGVGVMLALHIGAWASVRCWKRSGAVALEQLWQARIEKLRLAMGIRQCVPALQSALLDTPVVIGWLKPVILVPASALAGMDPLQLEALLLHELAHIRRCDYLVNMLQTLVEVLGFFHPAVWWISKVIRTERENCCDDLVVGALPDRRVYLRALLHLEELRGLRPAAGLAASGGSLLQRIRRLAEREAPDRHRSGLCVAGLALVAGLMWPLSALWSQPHPGGNWEQLFDGKSLAGWQQIGGPGQFHVEDGTIVGSSAPAPTAAFLCTRRQYSDFVLEFDVRVDADLNAGVQFRSRPGKPGEKGRVVGYQVEIDGEPGGASGGIWDEGRRSRWLQSGMASAQSRQAFSGSGAWNHYRLVCRRSSIQSWINGVACANLTDSLSDRGFIGLQVFNRQGPRPLAVRWRNIRLQRL
jgi:beta-lactamase regulating signal transducer with metallopeptidase domain